MNTYVIALILFAVLFVTGCGMIPAEMRAPLDQAIKEHGAGEYEAELTLKKDGKRLVSVSGKMECTNDMLKLTGCHKKGLTVGGSQ